MKKYILICCMFMNSYQIQSADLSASSDRTAVLKAKLAVVQIIQQEYFQTLGIFNEPAKLPIQFDRERELCRKLFDADRNMHRATLEFIRHAFKMKDPDSVDLRLCSPKAVLYCIQRMQQRPLTPQSSAAVQEFFEVKKPWLTLQEAHKEARTALKESEISDDEQ